MNCCFQATAASTHLNGIVSLTLLPVLCTIRACHCGHNSNTASAKNTDREHRPDKTPRAQLIVHHPDDADDGEDDDDDERWEVSEAFAVPRRKEYLFWILGTPSDDYTFCFIQLPCSELFPPNVWPNRPSQELAFTMHTRRTLAHLYRKRQNTLNRTPPLSIAWPIFCCWTYGRKA